MDAQDGPRLAVREDLLEVRDPRPVRRPDLDQPRPGPPDDLRDPHPAADLDELAARHRHAAPAPGQADREPDRRGVVVRHERVLGAGQRDEVLFGLAESRAAAPGPAVELEEEVGAGGLRGGLDRRSRPRRAPEVRVDDHAGRVDHGLEAHRAQHREPGGDAGGEIVDGPRPDARAEPLPLVRDDEPGGRRQRVGIDGPVELPANDGQNRLDAGWPGSRVGRHRPPIPARSDASRVGAIVRTNGRSRPGRNR